LYILSYGLKKNIIKRVRKDVKEREMREKKIMKEITINYIKLAREDKK